MAIRNFSDHAANERTFLAWVRTAIAIIAFGFVIERFDLFLAYAVPADKLKGFGIHHPLTGTIAGIALIVMGLAIIGVAAFRFMRSAKEIDADGVYPGTGDRVDLALAAMLILLGIALLFYLSRTLFAG